MKIWKLDLWALLLIAPAGIYVSAQSKTPAFSLSITQAHSSFCKCVTIGVKTTNLTDSFFDDPIQGSLAAKYQYSVRRDGEDVPENERLRSEKGIPPRPRAPGEIRTFSVAGAHISPHSSLTQILLLGNYFDMTKPGTYEITVSRSSNRLEPEKGAQVRSNMLTIVVPKAEKSPAAQ